MRSSEEEKPVDKQKSGSKNEPDQEMSSNSTIIPKTANTEIHVQGLSVDEKFSLNSNETILDLKKQISRKHNFTLNAIELSEIFENEEKI